MISQPSPGPRRRDLLKLAGVGVLAAASEPAHSATREAPLKISLAQWSLNKRLFQKGDAEPLDHLDFCKTAASLGIYAVEYVNQFFADKAENKAYLAEMVKRQDGEGVKGLLIMCDREGNLGDSNEAKRKKAVENHFKWLDAAVALGCHSIRVNSYTDAKTTFQEQMKMAADGLHALCLEADKRGLDVLVENHGGLSSHGGWLVGVMKAADHPRLGILPDFGNFYTDGGAGLIYNPYKAMREFMPWVKKAVSAKSLEWDTGAGEFYTESRTPDRELTLDFERLVGIVYQGGYRGYLGIESSPQKTNEMEGIARTKKVLDALIAKLS